ncbi:hypothetical protein WDW86_16565, partial [Bdellovibrionota bacterium FG-2]
MERKERRLRNFLFSVLSVAIFSWASPELALADVTSPECDCERFKSLAGLSDLTADAAKASQGGLGLALDSKAAAQATQLKIEADGLVPAHCKSILMAKPSKAPSKFQGEFFARLFGELGAKPAPNLDLSGANLLAIYDGRYSNYLSKMSSAKCAANKSMECSQSVVPDAWKQFSQQMETNPASLFDTSGITTSAGDLKLFQSYHKIITSGSEKEALDFVRAKSDGLSNEQFMTLVQMVGQQLGRGYDEIRNHSDEKCHVGIISGDQ